MRDAGFPPVPAPFPRGPNDRSKRPGFCCQVARQGSAEARRGTGCGDALPGVCSGSGKPVGYGPAVPRRGEQEQRTGRGQDFFFFADRKKACVFSCYCCLPSPSPSPAPPSSPPNLMWSPQLSSRSAAGRAGIEVVWVLGRRSAGALVTGGAGRQCPTRRDRASIHVSSTFLSEASAAAAGDAPKECHVHPQGRVWGSRHVSSREPAGLLKPRGASAPPHACPHLLLYPRTLRLA